MLDAWRLVHTQADECQRLLINAKLSTINDQSSKITDAWSLGLHVRRLVLRAWSLLPGAWSFAPGAWRLVPLLLLRGRPSEAVAILLYATVLIA